MCVFKKQVKVVFASDNYVLYEEHYNANNSADEAP
jgi:hypothetical protein